MNTILGWDLAPRASACSVGFLLACWVNHRNPTSVRDDIYSFVSLEEIIEWPAGKGYRISTWHLLNLYWSALQRFSANVKAEGKICDFVQIWGFFSHLEMVFATVSPMAQFLASWYVLYSRTLQSRSLTRSIMRISILYVLRLFSWKRLELSPLDF